MSEETLSRRGFLARAFFLGLAASGTAALFAGCKKGGEGGDGGSLDCTDTSGLTEAQVSTRNALNYVDQSTQENKFCHNCVQFNAPDQEGTCGTCNVVAGPINPDGYCDSWAAIPS